jgi:catechol 2,3-dioxygenase-like lactoylglutathione lyase family enzyme
MAQKQVVTHIRQLTTVAVPVTDAERALRFYSGILGFEKRRDIPFGQGQRWIEVAPSGAVTTIALAPPGEVAVGVDTGIRLATDDAEASHRELRDHGVRSTTSEVPRGSADVRSLHVPTAYAHVDSGIAPHNG